MKYPNRLKEVRERAKLTQTEMSAFFNMTMQNYQRYEYGKCELRSDLIIKICKHFDCTSDWLIYHDSKVEDSGVVRLAHDEKQLVDCYRDINDVSQSKALDFLKMVSTHPACKR